MRPLSDIARRPVEVLLSDLKSDRTSVSTEAGMKLVAQAKEYGLEMRDYLTLAINTRDGENVEQFNGMNGYEAALAYLNLPVRDDFKEGIVLEMASDTFQTYPGTRAMFPEVVDDMVQWKYRQDTFERTEPLVAQTRTVNGVEMISTVVPDEEGDYQTTGPIAELARVRISTIRTTQNSIAFYKHGQGYRTSYEFQRRARLDLLTPYAARVLRETERSKVWHATGILLNGDGVHGAAPVVNQADLAAGMGFTHSNGKIEFKGLMKWLIDRAKAGTPVDTVLGNWDTYIQWLLMFALPTTSNSKTDAEQLAATGFQMGGVPLLQGSVNFALSSNVPANQLVGYSRADTLEELIEAGSLINESERSIQNQSITYVRTLNAGYKLVFGDTRSVYNYGAAV